MPSRKTSFIPLIRPVVGKEELEEVKEVLDSGWLAQGPKVKEFERKLEGFLGAKHVVATSSCTTALSLAIDALDLRRGTAVVVPDFTFPATANVVVRAGGEPLLADVDLDTFGIKPTEVLKARGKDVSAVIPVHPFGHPFEVDEVYENAGKLGAEVIEDAATAFLTRYKGRPVGSRGRAVCFSFHPRKLLTSAEGGCLATDDDEVYEWALAMRSHGQVRRKGKAAFVMNGLNYRMSDVHAAIGIAQLRKVRAIVARRRKQAKLYDELIADSGLDLRPPEEKGWAFHTYQSYVVLLGRAFPLRDRCVGVLRKRFGIETQVGTYSLSAQDAFRSTRKLGGLPGSGKAYERSLTLPMYHSLSESQQAYVVDSLRRLSRA